MELCFNSDTTYIVHLKLTSVYAHIFIGHVYLPLEGPSQDLYSAWLLLIAVVTN